MTLNNSTHSFLEYCRVAVFELGSLELIGSRPNGPVTMNLWRVGPRTRL